MNLDWLENSIKYHGKELFIQIAKQSTSNATAAAAKDHTHDIESKNVCFYSEEDKQVKVLDKACSGEFRS